MGLFTVDIQQRAKDHRTLDLLEELGQALGMPEPIMLGNVNEILDKATRIVKAYREIGSSPDVKIERKGEPFTLDPLPGMSSRPLYGPPPIATSMEFSLYLAELQAFTVDNDIPRDLPSRVRKAGEELGELGEEIANFLSTAAITGNSRGYVLGVREEAADLVNTGIDVLLITGGLGEVVPALLDNLRRKAEKYRQGRNRPDREGRP